MFRHILVALDQSANSHIVVDAAITLAKATDATLMLLHVLSHEEEGSPQMPTLTMVEYYPMDGELFEGYRQQWQAYERQGLELLRSLTDQATAAGVKTEFTQNTGTPGRTICELARTWNADLIILGRRGRSGWNELLLGSVSNYVLHHAPCSVLTVQNQPQLDPEALPDEAVALS